jgi:hypothetical protein
MTDPTPPVSPDDGWLMSVDSARFMLEPPAPEVVGELIEHIRAMKAEREELAGLLAELANALRLNVPGAWDWPVPTGVSILHDRARAAAERLRGDE